MKKNIFVSLLIGMMGVIAFMGCEKPEKEDPQYAQTTQQESLSVVTAQSMHYMNAKRDSLYIITTQAEYESIFGDYVFDEFQSVDFSNYTLLFAQGSTPNLIGERNENITFEDNIYTWNINIVVGDATQPDYWGYVALINKKGLSASNVIFNLSVEPQSQDMTKFLIGEWAVNVSMSEFVNDNYKDTIVFSTNGIIEKHSVFSGSPYLLLNDTTLRIEHPNNRNFDVIFTYYYPDGIMFYNFLDNTLEDVIKNIYYERVYQ